MWIGARLYEETEPGCRHIYLLEGKYNPGTLAKRFGGWSSVPEAFRNFAKGKREWDDVVTLLRVGTPMRERGGSNGKPASQIPSKAQHARLEGRATYGHPLPFPGMHREPVNEQGVVLLFGMLAKELGYTVEAVQAGFPDCEAMRQISPEQWQRVHIEFEFESRNFRDHGHHANRCDVIVCWRHNWHECPKHMEIVELSRVIKSLAKSGKCA